MTISKKLYQYYNIAADLLVEFLAAESIFNITYIGSQMLQKNKSKKIDDMICNSDRYIFSISKKLFTCLEEDKD